MGTNLTNTAREAFDRRSWGDAFALLRDADQDSPLGIDDLERLAVAAYMAGRDTDCADVWGRAHQRCLQTGETDRAAQCAFWLGWGLMFRGEAARAGGWFARAHKLIDEAGVECATQGYLLIPSAYAAASSDPEASLAGYSRAVEIGERFDDRDLVTLGHLGVGESLIRLGQVDDGVALLDEVMVAVTAGEISPMLVGILYCAVIIDFHDIFDLGRAREWTTALTRWCNSQPDLVPFRGSCLVHRAEILHIAGAWPDAMAEIKRAQELLSDPPGQAELGAASYLWADLCRLRGDFAQADEAYRVANQWGYPPYPGLALLRLSQGQIEAAETGIRRALSEATNRVQRARLLGGYVEIMIASGDLDCADDAAKELAGIAAQFNVPLLDAISRYASGAVLLAEGDNRAALEMLRMAWADWQKLEAPFDAARARTLIGMTYRAMGDEDAALMEFDAAAWVFRDLGALPDLVRIESLSAHAQVKAPGRLTAREVEVLGLVATGATNRDIAEALFLSEKTVARHMSNIFNKIGVSSRAAATAWAFEHGLQSATTQN